MHFGRKRGGLAQNVVGHERVAEAVAHLHAGADQFSIPGVAIAAVALFSPRFDHHTCFERIFFVAGLLVYSGEAIDHVELIEIENPGKCCGRVLHPLDFVAERVCFRLADVVIAESERVREPFVGSLWCR